VDVGATLQPFHGKAVASHPVRAPQHLPGTNADVWDWQLKAHCRSAGWPLFFACDNEPRNVRAQREHRAKQICQGCPVLAECRAHAVTVGEAYGVWSGLTEPERTHLTNTQPAQPVVTDHQHTTGTKNTPANENNRSTP
jgi:WhiB family transcriptional regulator, redox-sensing transcriptional regulator